MARVWRHRRLALLHCRQKVWRQPKMFGDSPKSWKIIQIIDPEFLGYMLHVTSASWTSAPRHPSQSLASPIWAPVPLLGRFRFAKVWRHLGGMANFWRHHCARAQIAKQFWPTEREFRQILAIIASTKNTKDSLGRPRIWEKGQRLQAGCAQRDMHGLRC